jgi:6-phospho-3-hexuloisomerase
MPQFRNAIGLILAELSALLERIHAGDPDRILEQIRASKRLFLFGAGRSGLMMRALASRMTHLALPVNVVGEPTCPALQPGDLLIAASGSGTTRTTLLTAESAKSRGARLLVITATADSPLARIADTVILIPAANYAKGPDGVPTRQYGGSLFEQAVLLICDALAMLLQESMGVSDDQMAQRHANLE